MAFEPRKKKFNRPVLPATGPATPAGGPGNQPQPVTDPAQPKKTNPSLVPPTSPAEPKPN